MMVFTSIYGVVDGLFVSNYVGKVPFAAINLVMPFIMIFGGIGFMFGTGGSALVAKTLGEKKTELAERYFTMMVLISLISGIVISSAGIIFMRPISILLGADEEMLEYCVVYGRIVIGFNTAFMLQNLFQSFFITAEKPKLGLLTTVAAGLTNMVLDALFIAVFKWGVAGAAIATGISQCVGGIIPLFYFLGKNDSLLSLTRTKLELKPILGAAANGSSELVSNITSSVIGMIYNVLLLKYAGGDGVAAYGVLMYIQFVFIAVFIGYAIGVSPVVSYHYGAQNFSELQNLRKKSYVIIAVFGLFMTASAEIFAPILSKIFVGYDEALLEMTIHAIRVSAIMFFMAGFDIFASSFFTALNNGAVSAAISFLRTFVFKLSAVIILPLIFKLEGIWWAEVVAESFAFVVSVAFIIAKKKKYNY